MRVLFVFACALLLTGKAPGQQVVTDGIAVIVNDSIITYQDVVSFIRPMADLLRSQYGRQQEVLDQKMADLRADGTEQLIERQLILHEFSTAGYQFPESIIEDNIQDRIKQNYRDRVTFIQDLRARGKTYETFHKQQYEEIIVDAMRRRNAPQDILISPQKILDYYETNKTNFAVGDQVKLRMIVLNKPPGDQGAARQLAAEILRKIKEGAPFAEMAKIHSEGPTRNAGGDAGWAERDTLRKELADAAFSLKPGEVSHVIDLPESCWLLVAEEKRPAHIKPLADVRDEIERTLRLTEARRLDRRWIKRLREKAFVVFF
jgi:peptidyl-prolyl cis-trans isomerase SurA